MMTNSEMLHDLTRVTVWLAVVAWAAVVGGRLRGREIPGAREIWTLGLVAFGAHVAAAFSGFYGWSHSVALEETARQTAEATGFESGFGLWLNYLFGFVWLIDALRWWITGRSRPASGWRLPYRAFHGFLAFMIFNGTVIFGEGLVRWFGVAVFAILAGIGLRAKLGTQPDS